MTGRRSLHPDEEERFVADMTRELETLGATSSVLPEAGFSDRVMASIGVQPLPQPARAFGVALLAGRVRAAASAVGDAWRVSFGGFAPAFVRAQALALVLLV